MKKRKLMLGSLALIIIFSISGCAINNVFKSKDKNEIKNIMEYLTSKECSGRLTGTDGNLNTQKYIMKKYQDIGLEKINNSYEVKYNQDIIDINKHSMTIKMPDGSTKECQYGEEFVEMSFNSESFEGGVVFNTGSGNAKGSALVLENDNNLVKYYDETKIILVKSNNFIRQAKSSEDNSSPLVIQIDSKLYELLKENSNAVVKIDYQGEQKKTEQNNIVGKISGEDNKSAIILSAHFDAQGSAGNNIFKGAVDNASGTSVLIDIANKLKNYYKNKKPSADILFCAFNGEEELLKGSSEFALEIESKYKNIININIDCVGIKGQDNLVIGGDLKKDEKLINTFKGYLENKSFKIKCENQGPMSDHVSFAQYNISALELCQEKPGLFHSYEDNLDKIDYNFLIGLSNSLFEFITGNNSIFTLVTIENKEVLVEPTEEDKIISSEMGKMDFNEYKYMKIGEKVQLIHRAYAVFPNNIEELKKIYPQFKIRDKAGSFIVSFINLFDGAKPNLEKPEIGKIYKIKSLIKNISYMQLVFKDMDNTKTDDGQIKELLLRIETVGKEGKSFQPFCSKQEDYYEFITAEKNYTIGDKLFDIDGLNYLIVYDETKTKAKGIIFQKEINGLMYNCYANTVNHDWIYSQDEKSTEEFIKQIKLNEYVKDLFGNFIR